MITHGSWKQQSGPLGVQSCQQASATQQHPLGTVMEFTDLHLGAAEFIYLRGLDGTEPGSFVCYSEDDYSTCLVEGGGAYAGPVSVAMSACTSGLFGWYQRTGKAIGKGAPDLSDNRIVYATATPGVVDDAVAAGAKISRARSASNVDPVTGLAEFELQQPSYPSQYAVQPIVDNSGAQEVANGTIGAVATVDFIQDDSGGVDPGDDTIAIITSAANAGSADTAPVAAAVAQLAAKLNDNRDSVRTLTNAVAELAAKVNALVENQ